MKLSLLVVLCFLYLTQFLFSQKIEIPVYMQEDLELFLPQMEKILLENIASFWYDKSIDQINGGYIINFGPKGENIGEGTKMIVTQARTVWLFSRLARAGYSKRKYLNAAEHGYRFLRDKMWDQKNGGFYWEVDESGDKKIRAKKHLYGQAFALYAVSEYYLASKKKEVLDFAVKFFQLLEEKSHDLTFGGYIEFFNADWSTPNTAEGSYMTPESDMKIMNTHLHLMEAFTTFYQASQLPLARERLIELINIQSNTVLRKNIGACTDKYSRDWIPRLDGNHARVSYGHDIENIWLLIDACKAIGISYTPFKDLFQTLYEYSLKYGYDQNEGGFFYWGEFNQPATDKSKSWWVQSEALVSSLYMRGLTKDQKYLKIFIQTFQLIEKKFIDWENGEWHATVTERGSSQGNKGGIWKAGYHNGRAMIECLKMLQSKK
jgi:mannose/cellobiose epimerase-like protein (N-acyl-D-glucosamine 2-epimerase family)